MPLNKNNPDDTTTLVPSAHVLAHRWRKVFVFVVYKGVALLWYLL